MSIFKVVRTGQLGKLEDKASDQEEMQSAMSVVGDRPEVASKKEPDQGTGDGGQKTFRMSEDKKDIVIKVNGPLGKVFTEALNQALALETIAMSLAAATEEESNNSDVIHVGAFDTDSITSSDIVTMGHELTVHKDDDFVMVMESSGPPKFNDKVDMAKKLCQGEKLHWHYRVAAAVDKTIKLIRRA